MRSYIVVVGDDHDPASLALVAAMRGVVSVTRYDPPTALGYDVGLVRHQ